MSDPRSPDWGAPPCSSAKSGSWPTWEKAEQAMRHTRRKRQRSDKPPLRHVYRCGECTWFHLTSQERSRTTRRTRDDDRY